MTDRDEQENHPDLIEEPGFIVLGINYTVAIGRWLLEGRPVRAPEEVAEIFNNTCSPCVYFNRTRQSCKVCGCRANRHGSALVNKIAMKTESCPRNKW